MRIGETAERAGVSVRSLRYYEEQGLLVSTRTPSGQRTYTESDVARVQLLQRLYSSGLSSRTIAELLPCVDRPSAQTSDDAWDRLLEERNRIDQHITDLLQTRDSLDGLIAVNREHRAQHESSALV